MSPPSPRGGARARLTALLPAVGLLLCACAGLHGSLSNAPEGVPSGREGWLRYALAELRFEAPATWTRSGAPHHLRLERPEGDARLEVSSPEVPFADASACLADAEKLMRRGEGMERVRSHPTRFAGMRALSLEGDQNGWHVWAWVACDGGVQYQVFLTAQSPAPAEAVDEYRALTAGARVGGEA
ncbi:MAG TPA: hypothetical protein VFG59_04130 [Anaeromyxobacter sp.]|nr:hypothetical protein [Anaeromyxobacter sp.]